MENLANFTIDKKNFKLVKLNYGQNIRSNKHIGMYGDKPFNSEDHKKYLNHEKIENLLGLEIEISLRVGIRIDVNF